LSLSLGAHAADFYDSNWLSDDDPPLLLAAATSLSFVPEASDAAAALNASAADRDSLFGDELPPREKPAVDDPAIKGFLQLELARTIATPEHWSKMRTRADLHSQGKLTDDIKWKLGARIDYDAVYGSNDFYPAEVEKNQRSNIELRENYLDFSRGNWEFRLGRQHVVWGEMVGLFFADVVSARDQREFILPDFDQMRIPQWAARAEYFADDFHAEALLIPVASYDNIGKPGAEFYPRQAVPAGFTAQYRDEQRPARNADNMNYGARLSAIRDGWDVSGFAYSSMDVAPTFYRDAASQQGTLIYEARHDRIKQVGGTLAKDFGDVVLKGETVHTRGRSFTTANPQDSDGVVAQNTIDWALGLDFTLPADTRLNVQVFQRDFLAHDPSLISDKQENGVSLLLNHKFGEKLEAQATWIASTNRTDWLFRPRLTWNFERNWRLAVGADVFKGPPLGLFGRYDGHDRVYSELRYSF
jgi:hypothetical protein